MQGLEGGAGIIMLENGIGALPVNRASNRAHLAHPNPMSKTRAAELQVGQGTLGIHPLEDLKGCGG